MLLCRDALVPTPRRAARTAHQIPQIPQIVQIVQISTTDQSTAARGGKVAQYAPQPCYYNHPPADLTHRLYFDRLHITHSVMLLFRNIHPPQLQNGVPEQVGSVCRMLSSSRLLLTAAAVTLSTGRGGFTFYRDRGQMIWFMSQNRVNTTTTLTFHFFH